VKAAREAWFEGQPDLDPSRLVFLDETWTATNMARTRGRSPRGERLRSPVPHGHWKTTTLVAGLRLSGIAAPFVLDGPINRDVFQAYVERVLVPELIPGDIVVMDNLGSHKGPAVRAAIEAAGARLLFLPPYSPDFNPIRGYPDRQVDWGPLRWPSPSSRRCCARPPSAPSKGYGRPSDGSSTLSPQTSAPTSSLLQDTIQIKPKTL
jgi:hypothetical protein